MKKIASISNLFFCATIFLLLSGCRKNFVEKQAESLTKSNQQRSTFTPLTAPDVYVAGDEGGQAKYWKNGVAVTLTGGLWATGIAIVGTDVHVCGSGTHPTTGNDAAMYWKNGVPTYLSDGTDNVYATGIAVSGSDVYVSGRVGAFSNTAVYWKNGVEISLGAGEAEDVFVAANGDVYIANSEYGNPSYWKNGSLVSLSGPSSAASIAIAAYGSDVFVVGFYGSGSTETAIYWKNGVQQFLTSPSNTSAMDIAVSSTGIPAIAGISGTNLNNMHIGYWNAVGDLQVLTSGQQVASMMGITIDQLTDDIYVCGSEYDTPSTPPSKAKYWIISGGSVIPVTLSSNAVALDIALGQ